MLFLYMEKALERAEYKKLDDGSWFAEIPGFSGVWANAPTVEACRKELLEVLEGWLLIMKSLGSDLHSSGFSGGSYLVSSATRRENCQSFLTLTPDQVRGRPC